MSRNEYEHWKWRDLLVEIAEIVSKTLRKVAGLEEQMSQNFEDMQAKLDSLEASTARLEAANQQQTTALAGIQEDVTFLKNNIPATGGMSEAEVAIIRERVSALDQRVVAAANAAETTASTASGLDAQTDPNVP